MQVLAWLRPLFLPSSMSSCRRQHRKEEEEEEKEALVGLASLLWLHLPSRGNAEDDGTFPPPLPTQPYFTAILRERVLCGVMIALNQEIVELTNRRFDIVQLAAAAPTAACLFVFLTHETEEWRETLFRDSCD